MTPPSLRSWKRTAVQFLASSRANERPISFLMEESEIEIRTILESWREPDYPHFRVQTKDGRVYDLWRHKYEGFWEVMESARLDKYRR